MQECNLEYLNDLFDRLFKKDAEQPKLRNMPRYDTLRDE